MYVYFPSCNFTKASPQGTKKIREYLQQRYGVRVAGCCRPGHKTLEEGDIAVTNCQSCSAIIRENVPNVNEINIFQLLVNDEQFPWPDLGGESMTIQDCWRARNKPAVHEAVRAAMRKMNLNIVELAQNREDTPYCGVFRYNPMNPANLKIAPNYFGPGMEGQLQLCPPEEQQKRLEEHARQYTTARVAVYCNACLVGLNKAEPATGVHGVHLLDLALGTAQ